MGWGANNTLSQYLYWLMGFANNAQRVYYYIILSNCVFVNGGVEVECRIAQQCFEVAASNTIVAGQCFDVINAGVQSSTLNLPVHETTAMLYNGSQTAEVLYTTTRDHPQSSGSWTSITPTRDLTTMPRVSRPAATKPNEQQATTARHDDQVTTTGIYSLPPTTTKLDPPSQTTDAFTLVYHNVTNSPPTARQNEAILPAIITSVLVFIVCCVVIAILIVKKLKRQNQLNNHFITGVELRGVYNQTTEV
ncbi:unnamed protein product [Owenia fusiformis]|uniref:Uncharacterized protein n=1 Tax=Owenia fusiformis TaxID=6347 RepID=A0A8J1UW17_OWEFU|nr:unnamed protein product [Owenia fusiformis]